jgi:hypothetical protein
MLPWADAGRTRPREHRFRAVWPLLSGVLAGRFGFGPVAGPSHANTAKEDAGWVPTPAPACPSNVILS